ncbi:MAG: amidohydrolase family protein [Fimbriimonadales bacterium]
MRTIDCAIHPLVRHSDDLRHYMSEPWRSRALPPAVDRSIYRPTFSLYRPDSVRMPDELPGSDPSHLRKAIPGVDQFVLLPLTRGLLAETRHEVAIAAATNNWLADVWLGSDNGDGRFKGSIRVTPRSPRDAVREIERWAGHPHFVQVAVSVEAHAPYGREEYFPIWEAAARNGFPVAMHIDGGGTGVELPPTSVGYPTHFAEVAVGSPHDAVLHLTSLICDGVFERLESLVFVLADGAFDAVGALFWRLDMDWRAGRSEAPWVQRQPSHYLKDHVRFVLSRWDGPDAGHLNEALELWNARELLLYGSNYPSWDCLPLMEARSLLPERALEPIMGTNAADLYQLGPVSREPNEPAASGGHPTSTE